MGNKKPKRKIKFFTVLLLIITAYFVIAVVTQEVNLKKMNSQLSQLQDQQTSLERNNNEMKEQKAVINSPDYIEYVMRLKLGWVTPDEIKYNGVEQK